MEYITSDWHISHSNIIRYAARPFKGVEEMDKYIENMVFSTAKRGDTIYFLGDLAMDQKVADKVLYDIKKAGIKFVWILGNHDRKRLDIKALQPLVAYISSRLVIERNGKTIQMCHYPQWAINSFDYYVYGHVHRKSSIREINEKIKGKSLCVNIEFCDYKMITIDDIFTKSY